MDERELREIFLERLHIELHLFRDFMLRKSKADIYSNSYKIEIYINLYEILAEQAGQMKEPLLRKLLYQPSSILDAFYQEWASRDDNFYAELNSYVEEELEGCQAGNLYRRKDDSNGKEYNQAA